VKLARSAGLLGILPGTPVEEYPHMEILALAPEQNRGSFYWATVDVRTKPLGNSEAGILSALRSVRR
jgi:hypothetical protein